MLGILFHSGILPVCPLNYRGGSGCVGVEGGGPFFGTPYGESRSLFFVILASARNYFQFCNPTGMLGNWELSTGYTVPRNAIFRSNLFLQNG